MEHIKLINAKQAKPTYAYNNTKEKLFKLTPTSGLIKCVDYTTQLQAVTSAHYNCICILVLTTLKMAI